MPVFIFTLKGGRISAVARVPSFGRMDPTTMVIGMGTAGEYTHTYMMYVCMHVYMGQHRSGRGLLELKNGFIYDGLWSNNLMEGKGYFHTYMHTNIIASLLVELNPSPAVPSHSLFERTTTHPGGQVYQGTYKNGLREGRGSVHFAEVISCAHFFGYLHTYIHT